MSNINITSSECACAHFEVQILGRVIKGLRGFSINKTVDKEHIYGSGNEPLDILGGNIKYEGSVKLLGFEVDAMHRAAQLAQFSDITDVPHEGIVLFISYRKRPFDPLRSYTVTGVSFTETGVNLEQNAKYREITLPFIAMNIDQTIL
ncbi:MAG: hypothetical protein FDW93_00765 [Bergeyella sp.]|nr:hypothetical protein [Bergeyella sp.]